jgi:cytochrome c oxidase assembly factor CtaG
MIKSNVLKSLYKAMKSEVTEIQTHAINNPVIQYAEVIILFFPWDFSNFIKFKQGYNFFSMEVYKLNVVKKH